MRELVDAWSAEARALAAQCTADPHRLIAVNLPPVVRNSSTGVEEERLNQWEADVLAVHQVAAHWPAGSIELLVPGPVADQLLRSGVLLTETEEHRRPGL
ncbi:hypothetical protein ACFYST_34890 [Kitasatospora sp. NPDC004614]|uniref:hypothetical protein n=1 Tax=unclassified Kitasatospora TaxID=2633591 RepID=UPI0036C5250D